MGAKGKTIGKAAIVLLIGGTALFFLAAKTVTFLFVPPVTRDAERTPVVVDIPNGATLREAAGQLRRNKLITSSGMFVAIGKLVGLERRVIPGEYAFHPQMRPLEILYMMKEGRVLQYEVTIPEGYSLAQIARTMEMKKLVPADEFIRRATDVEFIRSLGYDAGSLEGYLYPESHFFTKRTGVDGILKALVRRFESVYSPELKSRAAAIGMTQNQVVTLASIIEKESSSDAERPLVSSVFHNRLRRGIPLQSDPTVIYAIPNFNGNLTRKNLMLKSPYNTYRVRGLPPGPIANPGKASLLAALYPATSEYLYFVSKKDGTHFFSKSLSEHNKAVQKYQLRRSKTRKGP